MVKIQYKSEIGRNEDVVHEAIVLDYHRLLGYLNPKLFTESYDDLDYKIIISSDFEHKQHQKEVSSTRKVAVRP